MTDTAVGDSARPTAAACYARARGLLLTPAAEWARIAQERPGARDLFLYWVLPLSAAFFLAPQLGAIAFPARIGGVAAAPSLAQALYTVLAGTVLMAAGVWALAWLINALAKYFDGKADPEQATKLAAYAGTGLWLSGLFGLIPALELAMAAGVVSIFTLYRGLPVLMKAPEEKALPYAATVTGAGAVIAIVLMALSSCMTMFAGPAPRAAPANAAAPKALAAATAATTATRDADKLRRLLPDAMPGGWVRVGVTQNHGGALGFTGLTVEAPFERAGQRLVLRVIDLGPAGAERAVAALTAARPAQDDPRALVRHDRTAGRYVYEEIDRQTGAVRWLGVWGDRIVLSADGAGGVTMADLNAAVALVDGVRIEQLARGL